MAENTPWLGRSFGAERLRRVYRPPADPLQMGLASVPARCCVRLFFLPAPVMHALPGLVVLRRLSEAAPSDSCAARSVCPELRRTVSAIPNRSAPKSTSTCHYNGSIFAVSQASCLPARQHAPHDPYTEPALCGFSPGPFGTCSFMDLMGNPPQGGDACLGRGHATGATASLWRQCGASWR